MSADYRRGFDDGQATARSVSEAMNGPDRTLYELVGGPKHGERIETRGDMYFRVMLPTPPPTAYWDQYNPLSYGRPDLTIRTGEYKRELVERNGRRRTVYVWQGER